jgi:hypothetical protein
MEVTQVPLPYTYMAGVRVMVFNAPFNNIPVISWRSVLLVEKNGVPGEKHTNKLKQIYKRSSRIDYNELLFSAFVLS